MKKGIAYLLAVVMTIVFLPIVAVGADTVNYIADNGEALVFNAIGEDLFGGWGSFDSEESLEHFTTGGYLVEGDAETTLDNAPAYWEWNEEGYLELKGSGGSTTKASMLTFVPLNDGNEIGEEKMYFFSVDVYTESAQTVKIAWNAVKSKQFWSIYSGTEYGGRYPDYGAADTTLDNPDAIDNNAAIYKTAGWHTVDGYMIAKSDAKYFMLNMRYMQGSDSSPTLLDNIVLYEVECGNAASELFVNDYVVYDSLPEIDGEWTDTMGFVTDGEYVRPEIGGIDTITAHYANGGTESFAVEVTGKTVEDETGGKYSVLGKNLIKNASFEYYETDNRSDGGTYPFIYSWESTITGSTGSGINNAENGCFEISSARSVTGNASMRIRYDDSYNNHSSFNQLVTLDEGTYYLSFYARRTTSAKKDLEIRLNGEVVHSFNDKVISDAWQRFSYVFDAKENDEFEFTGYNVAGVYLDTVSLMKVSKSECGATVIIKDENGGVIYTEDIGNLAEGARYAYDYPMLLNTGSGLYVYKSGSGVVASLDKNAENNVIELVYEKAEVEEFVAVIDTPHHVMPLLPETVTLSVNGRRIIDSVQWDEIESHLYEKEGSQFTVYGTVSGDVTVKAEVMVVKNDNYLTGRLSTADFTTVKKPATERDLCEITFDVLPLASRIDGVIGFTADNVTVDAWNSCGIIIRMYTDGRFQYYDGSEGYKWSNAFYSRNLAYSVRIFVNFETDTYSAYLSQKGSDYAVVICEEAAFRSDAQSMENIGQCVARGGSGAAAGEFIVANLHWGNAEAVSFLRSYKDDDGNKRVVLVANESGESNLYYASYTDSYYSLIETRTISYTKGEQFELVLEDKNNCKLMMFGDLLVPEFVAKNLEETGERSFTTSFMGSFAYYNNPYNSSLVDDDPGIVQVNVMEMYSDRITLTTKNYGEYNGGVQEPEPYTIIRENGDGSQVDEPLMRVLLLSDYQIGDYLLTDTESPIRPVFEKVCNDLEDEEFDAVMIGGDLTFSDSVSYERWDLVVDSVLGMLKEKISPNIYIISGNHDYHTGEAENYNSADYYNQYMKENLGSLEENGNGYFETSEYYEGDVLVAFCYEQDGVYFMGLSTSPDMMRGSLQNTNYNYTEGAMDWIEAKLAEIGRDKTVFLTAHFPLNNSNNIIKSSKGVGTDCTYRLIDILKDYPNLVYLYGHDHGSDYAYIHEATEERVTVYDSNGYKMN